MMYNSVFQASLMVLHVITLQTAVGQSIFLSPSRLCSAECYAMHASRSQILTADLKSNRAHCSVQGSRLFCNYLSIM